MQLAKPDRRRPDQRRARTELARDDIDRIGETQRKEMARALQNFRTQADGAAEDDDLRVGNGADRRDAARNLPPGLFYC